MPIIAAIRAGLMRFREVFGQRYREQELSAKIESHVQMHIEENLRSGMSPKEARRQALIQLGGVERTKEKEPSDDSNSAVDSSRADHKSLSHR